MKTIKITLLIVMMICISFSANAYVSSSTIRENSRFLTDKMAYELNLNANQRDDVFEVNYDFVHNVRYIMDDVVRNDSYALDKYYSFLNNRNDDLRWILSDKQYSKFITLEYFNRPLYNTGISWSFRVFNHYCDMRHFFYPRPTHYFTYNGGHCRKYFNNVSYYKIHCPGRYGHNRFYNITFVVRPHHINTPIINRPVPHVKPIIVESSHHKIVRPIIGKPIKKHDKVIVKSSYRPVINVEYNKTIKRNRNNHHVGNNIGKEYRKNKIEYVNNVKGEISKVDVARQRYNGTGLRR